MILTKTDWNRLILPLVFAVACEIQKNFGIAIKINDVHYELYIGNGQLIIKWVWLIGSIVAPETAMINAVSYRSRGG
jgi:uncharacterized membrane protein